MFLHAWRRWGLLQEKQIVDYVMLAVVRCRVCTQRYDTHVREREEMERKKKKGRRHPARIFSEDEEEETTVWLWERG